MRELSSFPEHLSRLFNLLAQNTERLEQEMNSGLAASAGAGFNAKHSQELRQLAEASKGLGQEVRAWLNDMATAIGKTGQSQRLQLLIEFIQKLPAAVRYDAYDKLMALELNRPDGIKIQVPVRLKGSYSKKPEPKEYKSDYFERLKGGRPKKPTVAGPSKRGRGRPPGIKQAELETRSDGPGDLGADLPDEQVGGDSPE